MNDVVGVVILPRSSVVVIRGWISFGMVSRSLYLGSRIERALAELLVSEFGFARANLRRAEFWRS